MANLSRKSPRPPVGPRPARPFERARPTPWSLFLKEFDKLEFDKDYHTSLTHAVTRWAADIQGATREKPPPCRPRFLKDCSKPLELEIENSFPCDAVRSCRNSHVCFSYDAFLYAVARVRYDMRRKCLDVITVVVATPLL